MDKLGENSMSDDIKAELTSFLDGLKPYIKLCKNTKNNNWEIKVFQGTTEADMKEIKALIDKTQKEMQETYDTPNNII